MNVVALLEELVAIASPSGAEDEAAQYTADVLTQAGLDVERVGGGVVALLDRGPGPRVLLASHLDTVPVGEGWTRDPAGAWEGDRLYGRGANDAKASVAAAIHAVSDLARSPRGAGDTGRVWLALNACEETTNAGMAAALEHIGPVDAGVIGEPTGLEVARAQSGLAVLTATWRGRSCHAAHVARVDHVNALAHATQDLAAFGAFALLDEPHTLLGPSTVVPTVLHSGERHNVVPDLAEAIFDARLAPPHDAAEVVAELERRLPHAEIGVRSDRLRPVETAEDHPLVRAALAHAGRERAIGSSTLSDMALLGDVPAVKIGPGETARSHVPDEFVLRAEVEAGAAFYRALLPDALSALSAAGLNVTGSTT